MLIIELSPSYLTVLLYTYQDNAMGKFQSIQQHFLNIDIVEKHGAKMAPNQTLDTQDTPLTVENLINFSRNKMMTND